MNHALQLIKVETPKVQDYFGDLFTDPLRLVVLFNYLAGTLNRFVDGSASTPS